MQNPMIPAISARWFLKNLRHYGFDVDEMLQGAGLDDNWLQNEDARISVKQYILLVERALDLSNEPALGLKIGQRQNLLEYGIWGYAVMSSTTAAEAMRIAQEYWALIGGLVNIDTRVVNDTIVWEVAPAFPFDETRVLVFAVEELLSTVYASCMSLFGRNIDITALHLTYPRPAHAEAYKAFCRGPIYFEAEKNMLVVPISMASLPVTSGHVGMKGVCENACRELLAKLKAEDAFIEEIRRLIIDSPGRFPKVKEIAAKMHVSPRTLHRRLKERGRPYQAVLDEIRARLAKDYLGNTTLSIDQISDLIGFSETTTFRQAFKKWTGVSPSVFRKRDARRM
jgi:AraC-like DNA-binding protein